MSTSVLTLSAYEFYINGDWRESKSGETIDIRSPYLYEVIGVFMYLNGNGHCLEIN